MIQELFSRVFRRGAAGGGRAFCVLGMHRSGTSCLTGTLDRWGVHLGDVSRQNPHNLKGNHENAEVVALNDAVLRANGGSWDDPPDKVVWGREHEAERDRIIAGLSGFARYGFKDPRCLVTWGGWAVALPGVQCIGTVRHPLAVALSLARRDPSWDIERGVRLWEAYNRRLLALYRERPFPIVDFDRPPEEYLAALLKLREVLGFRDAMPSGQFFESELRHHAPDTRAADVSESALALHSELLGLAL